MEKKKQKCYNFRNFDHDVWTAIKKEAVDKDMPFQHLVQKILKEYVEKNIKKE